MSTSISLISIKSGYSKQNMMRLPLPKVLLKSTCSISVLNKYLCFLLHFSIILFDVPFEGENIYNNFYSTTRQQKINHSTALNKLEINNLKYLLMSREVEIDLSLFWLIPCAAGTSIIDILGR